MIVNFCLHISSLQDFTSLYGLLSDLPGWLSSFKQALNGLWTSELESAGLPIAFKSRCKYNK